MADDQKFLADLESETPAVRFAAWRLAGEVSPAVVPKLGGLAASDRPGVAKAAREALATMTHSVGKEPSSPRRGPVVQGLMGLATDGQLPVRVHALRLLSVVAGEREVPQLAKMLADVDLREEAVYAIERIPGDASNAALVAAYKTAKDDFKPRILAALGHRRAAEAVELCAEAMRSPNKEIAAAGVRAFGRIGRRPAGAIRPPDEKTLSDWDRVDQIDSLLRYADAQARAGDAAEAMRVYRTALDRPEEHWQCAAIVGIAKLGSAEAASAILPKMKSPQRNVRITAANAWRAMAG
jgi:HEAT repeat protein